MRIDVENASFVTRDPDKFRELGGRTTSRHRNVRWVVTMMRAEYDRGADPDMYPQDATEAARLAAELFQGGWPMLVWDRDDGAGYQAHVGIWDPDSAEPVVIQKDQAESAERAIREFFERQGPSPSGSWTQAEIDEYARELLKRGSAERNPISALKRKLMR